MVSSLVQLDPLVTVVNRRTQGIQGSLITYLYASYMPTALYIIHLTIELNKVEIVENVRWRVYGC